MTNPFLLRIESLRTYFYSAAKQAFIRSVDGVDLDVEKGTTLGIVGESGSGKSITMLSVMGLIDSHPGVVSGKITLNTSQPINLLHSLDKHVAFNDSSDIMEIQKSNGAWKRQLEKNMQQIRGKEISMIFQNPKAAMNPFESVGKQISEMISLHTNIKEKNATKEKALSWLERVKIDSPRLRYDNFPHGLSGGMCQRAMIAMALSSEPSLLIADEPTTGLDATIQSKIVELLQEIKSDLGITTVLISHDIGVINKLSDNIAVMYGGRVLETGPAKIVLNKEDGQGHPYTQALLASRPDIKNIDSKGHLPAIPGEVLDTINVPKGCRFYSRCSESGMLKERCRVSEPPFFQASEKHKIRCWRFES